MAAAKVTSAENDSPYKFLASVSSALQMEFDTSTKEIGVLDLRISVVCAFQCCRTGVRSRGVARSDKEHDC